VLAGVAERYATGLIGMKAFVAPLHHMKMKCGIRSILSGRSGTAAADSSAKFCIEMWRAEAILLWHDRESVAVPMRHMAGTAVAQKVEYRTESDAGPEGIGAVVYDARGRMLAYTSYRLPWTRDKRNLYQNQREYIGLIVAMILLHKVCHETARGRELLCRETVSVQFTGDNTTAQAWIEKEKCSSRCGQFSSMAVTWFQIHSQLRIVDTVHKEGVKMGFVDDLSRFRATPQLDAKLSRDLHCDQQLTDLLIECDPSRNLDLVDHHIAFQRINESLLTILRV